MRLSNGAQRARPMNGWLTDALRATANTAKSLLPGQQPTTINVQAPSSQTPEWVTPALMMGGAVILVVLLGKKKR